MGAAPARRVFVTAPPEGTQPGPNRLDTDPHVPEAELLELAVTVARDAGALLLERFDSGRERALESKSTPTDLVNNSLRLVDLKPTLPPSGSSATPSPALVPTMAFSARRAGERRAPPVSRG